MASDNGGDNEMSGNNRNKTDRCLSPSKAEKALEAIEFLSSIGLSGGSGAASSSRRSSCSRSSRSLDPTDNSQPSVSGSAESRNTRVSKAADKALDVLQNMRSGLYGVKRELSQSFPRAKRGKVKERDEKVVWKHRFVCLARKNQLKIPTTEAEKDQLLEAGLGEQTIEFHSLELSGEEFKELLCSTFPKLRDGGGYELCRCMPNSRQLDVLTPKAQFSPKVLKERGSARTYIRPLQRDLDITPIFILSEWPKEECLTCGKEFTVAELKDHIYDCGKTFSPTGSHISFSDSDSVPPLPSPLELPPVTFNTPAYSYDPTGSATTQAEGDEIEEQLLQSAINQSYEDELNSNVDTSLQSTHDLATEIQLIIKKHCSINVVYYIDVRREHILEDALKEARKTRFSPRKCLNVNFVGEGAVDQGGPRREFFHLLALNASNKYFEGKVGNMFFVNNVSALQNKDFYYIGQYIAMSITQGGRGFPFLCQAVYLYITTGVCTNIFVENHCIPNSLRFIIEKIQKCDDDSELRVTMAIEEAADLILQTGYRKPLSSVALSDKQAIISAIIDYHLMLKVKSMMDQFIEGLSVLGLLEKMRENPVIWQPLFTDSDTQLDAVTFKTMFHIQYAPEGSNDRRAQMQAYIYFIDFVDNCADEKTECSLEDIMMFFTGCKRPPPLGFEKKPKMVFIRGPFATSSTCDLQLRIPVMHSNYKDFEDAIISSIKDNDGFGGP